MPITNAPKKIMNSIGAGVSAAKSAVSNTVSKISSITSGLTSLQLGGGNSGQLMDILLSTGGKKTENNELKYKVFIQFDGHDKNYYDDTLTLVVYRFGFVKSAPFYSLKINITPVLLEQLKFKKSKNEEIKLKMWCYTINTEENNKLKNLVFERNFVVVGFVPKTDTSVERGTSVMVEFYAVNPLLNEMSNSYTYNKIQNSKTPYEVLLDYEGYIKSTYGDNFESKHVLNKKNEHKYEQILTKPTDQDIKLPNNTKFTILSKHDIDIPMFLQYKYKIDNTIGFYFYDDFNMKSKKEIVRYFLSFHDKNKFEKFELSKRSDVIKQSQYENSYAYEDVDRMVSKDNPVVVSKCTNSPYSSKNTQTSKSTKVSTQTEQKTELSKGDVDSFFYGKKTSETTQQNPGSANQMTHQVPDNEKNSQERVTLARESFGKKIDRIDCFSTHNCGFDWLQFGMLYAMNQERPQEYLHTPICIVNMFHRMNTKENVLVHSVRYQMIKFSAEETQEQSASSSTSNQPGSNSLAKAAQDKVNASNPETIPSASDIVIIDDSSLDGGASGFLNEDGRLYDTTKTGPATNKDIYKPSKLNYNIEIDFSDE